MNQKRKNSSICMDSSEILVQIENFQKNESSICSEWIEQNNIRDNMDFNKSLVNILTDRNDISLSQKQLVICFMKQYEIHFLDQNDISSILYFLDVPELKHITSSLIVKNFDNSTTFFEFLINLSDKNPSNFLLLLSTYLEVFDFDENLLIILQKILSILQNYIQSESVDFNNHLDSIKCLISLSNSIKSNELLEQIMNFLFNCFMLYQIDDHNFKFFFEILRVRLLLEKINPNKFYQKIYELSEYIIQKGPPNDVIQSSFDYYLSQMIFHSFEFYQNDLSNLPIKKLILILMLFTVNHNNQIETWEYSVEDFFSDNEMYLLPKDKRINDDNDSEDQLEENSNFIYKESYELQQFIFLEIIRLGGLQIDQSNILSLAKETCISIIGTTEFPNYQTPLINLSIILFFMNIESIIQINGEIFANSSNNIGIIYFILYCAKKGILLKDISQKIEYFLNQEHEMYKLIVASILIYYNSDDINPILYSECFVQCLNTLGSFYSEKSTGIMNLLILLADFENKPSIVPGFSDKMEQIIECLTSNLVLFQDAYQSTVSMCNLIAHFLRYIPFQSKFLSFFLDFINKLCTKPNYANLGIRLEYAILDCKSAVDSFNEEQIKNFYQLFINQLSSFDLEFIQENTSLITSIILISTFFAKKSIIITIEEWIFKILSLNEIPSKCFDKIAQLTIHLVQNNNSVYRFDILKQLIIRSELLSKIENDNPLLFTTIAILAHLSINNSNDFKLLMESFEFDFSTIMTAIYNAYNSNNILNIADSRIILIMMGIYRDCQVIEKNQNEKMYLAVLNQLNTKKFYEKVFKIIFDNKLDDLYKSSYFDRSDIIFNSELMSCSFSQLLNWLIPEPFTPEINKFKTYCYQFLIDKNL